MKLARCPVRLWILLLAALEHLTGFVMYSYNPSGSINTRHYHLLEADSMLNLFNLFATYKFHHILGRLYQGG
jgi:hypothetical protein